MRRLSRLALSIVVIVVVVLLACFKSADHNGCEKCDCRSYVSKFQSHRFREDSDAAVQRPHKGNLSKHILLNHHQLNPVRPEDWTSDLFSYRKLKETQNSLWWQAAAFLEIDLSQRPKDYFCKDFRPLGNWFGCFDGSFKLRRPCLVYSFGIANDSTFDDAMAEQGCEVHSFDPSMGKPDHVRDNGVHFHPIGISGKTIQNFHPRLDIYVKEEQSWTLMTLEAIMTLLGHSERQLDILKLDIEGHEWNVLEYLLEHHFTSRINQLLIEFHLFPDWPAKSEYKNFLKAYKGLHDNGYKKFFTDLHTIVRCSSSFRMQADVGYVNMGNIIT